MMTNSKRYYSAVDVAGILGISKQTVLRYEKKGIFPKARRNLINKRREYAAKDIEVLKGLMGRR
ncbi:helix-turn-helix transcriptional regulator [Candidatus Omnitrophota bacterium]